MRVRSLSDDQSASYTTPTSVLVLFISVCVCFVFKRRKKNVLYDRLAYLFLLYKNEKDVGRHHIQKE